MLLPFLFSLLCLWYFTTTSTPSAPSPLALPVCSHQARTNPSSQHGPVSSAALLHNLRTLLSAGVACFDLDLSPLSPGSTAVAHPAALAAAGGASAGAADYSALFELLGGSPALPRLTLELKPPLGEDSALVAALAARAAAAGLLPRLAVLGLAPGAPLPPGLHRGLAVRDDRGCALAELTPAVTVVMPSKACWAQARVRQAIEQWAATQAPTPANLLAGEVHVWVVDEAATARQVLQHSQGGRVRLVSNDVGALLGKQLE